VFVCAGGISDGPDHPHGEASHRLGNVLDGALAQIFVAQTHGALDLIVDVAGNADAARLG
jgi:hypothetical protein